MKLQLVLHLSKTVITGKTMRSEERIVFQRTFLKRPFSNLFYKLTETSKPPKRLSTPVRARLRIAV